jgi:hypothetical protein
MNLDTSKFKKIEASDKHTVLLHPSGHTIKVAHSGLSEKMRKELDQLPMHLAKGGMSRGDRYSKYTRQYDPNQASKAAKPSTSDTTMPGSPTMAKDAYTEPQDAGTDYQNDSVIKAVTRQAPPFGPMGAERQRYPICINPSCKSYGHSHPNCRCYGGVPEGGYFAEGGQADYFCSKDRPHEKGCQFFAEGEDVKKDPSMATPTPLPDPTPEEQPQAPDNSWQQSQGNAPQNSPPVPVPESAKEWEGSYGTANPNPEISDETKKDAAVPPPSTPGEPVVQEKANTYQEHQAKSLSKMIPEANMFEQDVNSGAIKPETYHSLFANEDTLPKIGTLFGLMLSGMGSGLTHTPNMVMQMMDSQIQNDLKRQELSSSNKQSFLKINQAALMGQAGARSLDTKTAIEAKALSLSNARRTALHALTQKYTNMPDGPLKQQAMQQLALMNQAIQAEDNDTFTKAASAAAMASLTFGDQSQGGQPNTMAMKSGLLGEPMQKMGQDIEEKTIPGVPEISGQRATRPIPQASRDQALAMTTLANKAKDLMAYSKAHEGTWNPKTRAIAQQKAEEMVGFYGSSLGVSGTQGNRTWLEDQIAQKNPTSAIAQELYGSSARLKEIADSNQMRKQVLLNSLGFKPKGASSNQSESAQSKKGHPIIYKDGKAYYK